MKSMLVLSIGSHDDDNLASYSLVEIDQRFVIKVMRLDYGGSKDI